MYRRSLFRQFRHGGEFHRWYVERMAVGIQTKKVCWLLDADIRGFFDTLSHEWLVKFIEHRIADPQVVRPPCRNYRNAGVMEEGKRIEQNEGVPQGGSVSPLLANIYLHSVFDLWADQWRKTQAQGDVIIVLRQTMAKRMHAKLKSLKEELRRRMHQPLHAVGRWLMQVVNGHNRYYGVPRNSRALKRFRDRLRRLWRRALNLRSQKGRINNKRMDRISDRWLQHPRICHPYPETRLAVIIQGKSPVR